MSSPMLFLHLRVRVAFSFLPLHSSYLCLLLLQEEKMLGILVRHRIRSGVSGIVGMEVDGLPFHGTHAQMIQKLLDVTMARV